MSGIDFLLERAVTDGALRRALAEVSGAGVEVVREIEDASGEAELLAQVFGVRGEFKTHVATFGRRDFGVDDVRALSRVLDMPALVPDGSVNPYAFVLLGPDGSEAAVTVDPESLDEREEYRLAAS